MIIESPVRLIYDEITVLQIRNILPAVESAADAEDAARVPVIGGQSHPMSTDRGEVRLQMDPDAVLLTLPGNNRVRRRADRKGDERFIGVDARVAVAEVIDLQILYRLYDLG